MNSLALFAQIGVDSIARYAILLIVILVICAIVYWVMQKTGITIPPPFSYVLYGVLAILAILLLCRMAGML